MQFKEQPRVFKSKPQPFLLYFCMYHTVWEINCIRAFKRRRLKYVAMLKVHRYVCFVIFEVKTTKLVTASAILC